MSRQELVPLTDGGGGSSPVGDHLWRNLWPWVFPRTAGYLPARKMQAVGRHPGRRRHRARAIDDCPPKIEERVVRSQGKIRADVVHKRIAARGLTGGERPPVRAFDRGISALEPRSRPGRPRAQCKRWGRACHTLLAVASDPPLGSGAAGRHVRMVVP